MGDDVNGGEYGGRSSVEEVRRIRKWSYVLREVVGGRNPVVAGEEVHLAGAESGKIFAAVRVLGR